jgi:hypothetical protein
MSFSFKKISDEISFSGSFRFKNLQFSPLLMKNSIDFSFKNKENINSIRILNSSSSINSYSNNNKLNNNLLNSLQETCENSKKIKNFCFKNDKFFLSKINNINTNLDNSNFDFNIQQKSLLFQKYETFKLDQLYVLNKKLNYFAFIDLPDKLQIITIIDSNELIEKLFLKNNDFIYNKPNTIILSNILLSRYKFIKLKDKLKLNDVLKEKIKNLKELVIYHLEQIQKNIQTIQFNYSYKKNENFESLLIKIAENIDDINLIFDFCLKKKKLNNNENIISIKLNETEVNNNNKNIIKINNEKNKDNEIFKILEEKLEKREGPLILNSNLLHHYQLKKNLICQICKKIFNNPCALGGHMSRRHPHKSLIYQKKLNIRNNRVEYRQAILDAKINLTEKYGYDYKTLINKKNGKLFIKKLIIDNKREYIEILKNIKNNRGLNECSYLCKKRKSE